MSTFIGFMIKFIFLLFSVLSSNVSTGQFISEHYLFTYFDTSCQYLYISNSVKTLHRSLNTT